VVAAAEAQPAQLAHLQPAPLGAVVLRDVLERDDAVGEALQLQVALGGRLVVEHQHGAGARAK
jgi:hypothetical protein